ncbi:MAG TPA: LPS export ABC transporter periplasmic protein LptC [Firmicutes bacterium]|nr:LPS export ABC transporter periplasmic protein LptC [Bacillota bacterium]HHY98805.1 LPS export ABC transporter periplasmic protein LptC [Bacillota bacterium]
MGARIFCVKPGIGTHAIFVFLLMASIVGLVTTGRGYCASTVRITADQKIRYDLAGKVFVAEGNVRIIQDDTTIKCQRAEITTDKKVATITGAVELSQPNVLLKSDTLVVYFNEKRVIAQGNVTLVKSDENVTLKANRLEYWTQKKQCVAEGNVFVTRKDTKAWGDKATYSEKEKLLILTGTVKAESPEKERLNSKELKVYTDKDLIEASGGVDIEFDVKEESSGNEGK